MSLLTPKNQNDVSFFDVKELYDEAYKQKAQAEALTISSELLMEKANELDSAYRLQWVTRPQNKQVGVAA